MRTCVMDTSVAVAWYLDEAFSPSARTWQEQLLDGRVRLLVPSLHFWEFGNALRTLVMRQEINAGLAEDIYRIHLEAPLETAEPDPRQVFKISIEYGTTAYDAVFIALCLSMDIPLVTAEKTSKPWVVKLGDRIEAVR